MGTRKGEGTGSASKAPEIDAVLPGGDQPPLRAELLGSNTCAAGSIVCTGNAPVLALCRQLLAAGVDPDMALEVFRGATVALRVRAIGAAATLTVRESTRDGRPRFAPLSSDGSATMRFPNWPERSSHGNETRQSRTGSVAPRRAAGGEARWPNARARLALVAREPAGGDS